MTFPDFVEAYQWNYRPQHPRRPDWFKEWPDGARMAVMLILLHEWESVPAPGRPMPSGAHHTFDYLALGAREYGARSGIWRLLDVLDRHDVKATVIASGLVAELFPESVREVRARGHELATHGWDQSMHPPVFKTKDEERNSIARLLLHSNRPPNRASSATCRRGRGRPRIRWRYARSWGLFGLRTIPTPTSRTSLT